MNVILYATSSDNRKITKALNQIKAIPDVKIKDDADDVINPSIIVGTFPGWDNVNYIYISEFHRYYYAKAEVLTGGRIQYNCHVDPLMSHRSALLSMNAIIDRAENATNPYLVDSELGMLNYRSQKTIAFPSAYAFNSNLTYVLTVAGGGGSL